MVAVKGTQSWLPPQEVTVSVALREAVDGHPLVAEILARRGITDPREARAFLDPAYYQPALPTTLPDLEIAAGRLLEAVCRHERILVWGDFDVDGQTSTALLVDALRELKADVDYHIPNRLEHGHGVQVEVLQAYLKQGVDVVLTCDTGIAALDAAEAVRKADATLLITDHHALPPVLPRAFAVVNPQHLPEGHSLRGLPGVGVAYKLMQQLHVLAGREGETQHFLDLVALGIVADVAIQRHDTRYLLQMGIEQLRYPKRIGLQALMRTAQVDPLNLSSDTIGYQIGPRLNALGRLGDAALAVELLTTHDEAQALQIAAHLELLNNQRKQVEDQIYAAAQEQVEKDSALLDFEALVLGGVHWHPGVIGIVASRLVEQYHRPVVLLQISEGQFARGSARSVPGVDIGAAIAANAHLLESYGGHPGAAGVTLDPDLIPQFRRQLSDTVGETRDHRLPSGIRIDAMVPFADLSMELADELNRLAPFGEGNPPIHLMTSELHLVKHMPFGVGNKHRRMTVEDQKGIAQVVTWWRGGEHPLPAEFLDLIYIPRINDYKGRRSLQLEWVASRPVPGITVETGPRYEVIDLRGTTAPEAIIEMEGAYVWAEGIVPGQLPFMGETIRARDQLAPCKALLIWTAPPGPQELEQALEKTRASKIFVVAQHIPEASPAGFLKRLAGLVKYAQRVYDGRVSVLQLAGVTAQREITVREGLEWLVARGQIDIRWTDGDKAILLPGSQSSGAGRELEPLQDAIRALLAESSAFRAYFQHAELNMFFEA